MYKTLWPGTADARLVAEKITSAAHETITLSDSVSAEFLNKNGQKLDLILE